MSNSAPASPPVLTFIGTHGINLNRQKAYGTNFKLVSSRRFPEDKNRNIKSYVKVTLVQDDLRLRKDLTAVALPVDPNINYNHYAPQPIDEIVEGYNYASPRDHFGRKTEYNFKWHLRGTELYYRSMHEEAERQGMSHVSKTVHVTFTLYVTGSNPPFSYQVPHETSFCVSIHRINMKHWIKELRVNSHDIPDAEEHQGASGRGRGSKGDSKAK